MSEIFNEIKKQNLFHFSDLNKQFDLKCDASDIGIGSLLLQEGKLFGIFSSKFKASERNYTVVKQKDLGIIESMKHYRQIIFGAHTIIHTDNENLTFRGDLTKRMNRCLILLEVYDYEIKHVKGDLNSEADLLSR
ncbi:Retrovirus-related Pol polyprotein from transposon 17.6 [Dictyocoela muelleri]|nr:Retrovirus-related Pol polyprotein from transposon 17.6 [Dictyocoela muelleri]